MGDTWAIDDRLDALVVIATANYATMRSDDADDFIVGVFSCLIGLQIQKNHPEWAAWLMDGCGRDQLKNAGRVADEIVRIFHKPTTVGTV